MTKQATTILIALVLLTLAGLLIVSNFISEPKPSGEQLSAAALVGNSPKPTPLMAARPLANATQMVADLTRAQEQIDAIVEAVKNNNWGLDESLFVTFELKDRRLPTPQLRHPDIAPILQDFFDLYVVQLDRAIEEKQAKSAQIALNQLRGIVAEAKARMVNRTAPVEVQRLHHLVRELALWKDVGDERMLRTRLGALREAWNDASPLIRTRKQSDTVAPRFEALLAQAVNAENAAKLVPLLPELNEELDQIDDLFQPAPAHESSNPKNDE